MRAKRKSEGRVERAPLQHTPLRMGIKPKVSTESTANHKWREVEV